MNIEKLSENIASDRMTKPTAIGQSQQMESKSKIRGKDSVDTSDLSHLISTNIPVLDAANTVRADKIKQFESFIDSREAIPEKSINLIFKRLLS